MAALASMSESLQVSIALLRHQDHYQEGAQPQEPQKGVSRGKQVLLVLAVCGMEMCVTFEQIYQILIVQYLGVPLSLVSINGVICGVASMALIPIIGVVTDTGSNPKRRKMVSLLLGMVIFQIGILLLLAAGILKIASLREILTDLEKTVAFSTPSTVTNLGYGEEFYNSSVVNNSLNEDFAAHNWSHTNGNSNIDSNKTTSETSIPTTAYITIVGFAFVDIGFDTSMSVSRAYILESVPKFQHVKLLVMATLVQASSGTIFALLGVLDISDGLGNAFGVDGTSAVLVFFCVVLFVVITLGFASTILTGYHLTKHQANLNKELEARKTAVTNLTREHEKPSRRRLNSYKVDNRLDAVDSTKKPLLQSDVSSSSYAAMNISSSFTHSGTNIDNDTSSEKFGHTPNLHRSGSRDKKSFGAGTTRSPSCSETVPELDESNFDDCDTIRSQTSEHEKLEPEPESNFGILSSSKNNPIQQTFDSNAKPNVKKRLAILVTSAFFTWGTSTAFLYYAANALTIGIFQGDPNALPGTEGKDFYDKGLQAASLGNLTFYILFTITSLLNNKLIELVGERVLFIVFHVAFLTPLVALVTTQRIEAYFATVVMMGVYRHTVYTLVYIMASKIYQEAGNERKSDVGKTNLGKVMSLMGFLIPAHYLLVSSIMGPILEATKNVWIPLMYGLGCGLISILIFSFTFFIK